MGNLCSKFGKNRSTNYITFLSTDAGRTDGRTDVYVILYSVQSICIALDRQLEIRSVQESICPIAAMNVLRIAYCHWWSPTETSNLKFRHLGHVAVRLANLGLIYRYTCIWKKLTSLKHSVRTMWWYQSTKTAKIVSVTRAVAAGPAGPAADGPMLRRIYKLYKFPPPNYLTKALANQANSLKQQ